MILPECSLIFDKLKKITVGLDITDYLAVSVGMFPDIQDANPNHHAMCRVGGHGFAVEVTAWIAEDFVVTLHLSTLSFLYLLSELRPSKSTRLSQQRSLKLICLNIAFILTGELLSLRGMVNLDIQ